MTQSPAPGPLCLALPTNRACGDTIRALAQEAAYAARQGARVHLLILDSSDDETRAEHARIIAELPGAPGVTTHHFDEERQRSFLRRVIWRAGAPDPEHALSLMLPERVSYGACTNRLFLFAAALGCVSVHRRDSDSRYQTRNGEPVFPVHHELATLGRPAGDVRATVSETQLDDALLDRPVAMVGASFIGDLSVDVAEIAALDPAVYADVVGLWAPGDASAEDRRLLVEQSFTGAGTEPFADDRSLLTLVDPMRVDMCNVSFYRSVYERVPLPPATDTIGSDYFLIHLVHDAALPGVLHNRHIENFHTPERRTDAGFHAYQDRFVKFLLSMLYFHEVYRRMAATGAGLLDAAGRVRPDVVSELVRETVTLDRGENHWRLDRLRLLYTKLGGRYAAFAAGLVSRRDLLLNQAAQDMADFAGLTEIWESLVVAARRTGVEGVAR